MSYSSRTTLLLLTLLTSGVAEGHGQSAPRLAEPICVRVTAAELGLRNATGRAVQVGEHSLLVEGTKNSFLVPLSAIDRLEVSGGNTWSETGVLLGLGAGIAVGLLVGSAPDCSGGAMSREGCLAAGAVGLGVPLGVLFGIAAGHREIWLPVMSNPAPRTPEAQRRR